MPHLFGINFMKSRYFSDEKAIYLSELNRVTGTTVAPFGNVSYSLGFHT
jgi:hypothetical protein